MSSQLQTNSPHAATQLQRPEDFLSPAQRLDAIADILAEITLDSLEKDNYRMQNTDQMV